MRKFNVTGTCVPNKHYMVDISKKLEQIEALIEEECYFTINRARQYGKTTTFSALYRKLKDKYYVLKLSFEGLGDIAFENDRKFVNMFIRYITEALEYTDIPDKLISEWEINELSDENNDFYKIPRAYEGRIPQ